MVQGSTDMRLCAWYFEFSGSVLKNDDYLTPISAKLMKYFEGNIIKTDKTWSSVSNSSLSKIFALRQFRKLKLQKLHFLPQNMVLGLNKMSQKIILGQKKIWVQNKFGFEKILVGIFFCCCSCSSCDMDP